MAEETGEWGNTRMILGQGIRALGLGLKLVPTALFQMSRGYRRFSSSFVEEAVRQGIPEAAAWDMADELRPGKMMKALKKQL